jgi:hypothetical protein
MLNSPIILTENLCLDMYFIELLRHEGNIEEENKGATSSLKEISTDQLGNRVVDCAGIFKQSMGASNRVGIRLSYRPAVGSLESILGLGW